MKANTQAQGHHAAVALVVVVHPDIHHVLTVFKQESVYTYY
jgi:hypothetical protein